MAKRVAFGLAKEEAVAKIIVNHTYLRGKGWACFPLNQMPG